jgi:hypothetical protein
MMGGDVGATLAVARDAGTRRNAGRGCRGDRPRSPVMSGLRYDVDFDFNIQTAFIRLGRVRPVGAGYPPYNIDIEINVTQKQ